MLLKSGATTTDSKSFVKIPFTAKIMHTTTFKEKNFNGEFLITEN